MKRNEFIVGSCYLLVLCLLIIGCPAKKNNANKRSLQAEDSWYRQWTKGSWVDQLDTNVDFLESFFGDNASPALRQDGMALFRNNLMQGLHRPRILRELSDKHMVLRARMHLQLSRFYRQSFQWALDLNLAYFLKREKLVNKSQLGKLFHFYLGRLYCFQKKFEKGRAHLKKARQTVSAHYQDRLQTWLLACRDHRKRDIMSDLETLRFQEDPDGWSEWILVHDLFGLQHKSEPKRFTNRAKLFFSVWKQRPFDLGLPLKGVPVQRETIQDKETSSTLEYYDPFLDFAYQKYHAHQALRLLKKRNKDDRYAPFFLGLAYELSGQKEKAKKWIQTFLEFPPSKVSLTYLLFSNWRSSRELVSQALLIRLRLSSKKERLKQLNGLKKSRFEHLYLDFAETKYGHQKNVAYRRLLDNVQLIQLKSIEFLKHFEVGKTEKMIALMRQLNLGRFLWRSPLLLGSQAAVKMKDYRRAIRWLERLHVKEKPYKIGGENHVNQMIWTARTYMRIGRLDIAMEFLRRNRDRYPSFRQHCSLLGLLRIFKGMGSHQPVRSGG